MNIEQVKAEAKKQFDKELTDEQAQALLEKGGELTDEMLEAVAGGAPTWKDVCGTAELNNIAFRHPPIRPQDRK